MPFPALTIKLPGWVDSFLSSKPDTFPTIEQRMELVISLSRLNIQHKTGGPFAAAVFSIDTGKLIAPGVNMVVASSCSVAHGEIVALSIAQKFSGCFDLGAPGHSKYELVSSTAPCAMCLGAIPWSGVKRLICGARDEDARSIGFDEGSKMSNWIEELEKRGISVINDVLRSEAASVLKCYRDSGGSIYNGRQDSNLT